MRELGSRAAHRVSPGPAALSPVVLARLGVRALAVLALLGVVVAVLRWLLAARMLRARVALEVAPAAAVRVLLTHDQQGTMGHLLR